MRQRTGKRHSKRSILLMRKRHSPANVKYTLVPPLVRAYLETRDHEPEQIRSALTHFERWFGGVKVSDINQAVIDDYAFSYMEQGNQMASAVRRLKVLKAAIRWGVKATQVKIRDVRGWELPFDRMRRRERALTRSEVARVLWAARKLRRDNKLAWLEIWLWIAVFTGARPTAIRTLQWKTVDLAYRAIDFRNGTDSTKKRGVVPIATALLPVLKRARREAIGASVVSARGGPPSIRGVHKAFTSLIKPLGLGGEGLDGVTPYTMRHTAASLMLRNGAGAWAVAGVLKISMQRLTSVYAKHFDDHLREAVNKL